METGNALLVFMLLLSTGCGLVATRPKLEMTLAATAFLAAKKANAHTLAADQYRQAEFYYLKAKAFYKKKFFSKAKQFALRSKEFAERAEYNALRRATLEKY